MSSRVDETPDSSATDSSATDSSATDGIEDGIEPRWLLVYRPRRTPIYSIIAATLVIIAHVVIGALLTISDTGTHFQVSDQVAMGLIGVVIGGSLLLLCRPRLRVGAEGVAIRNLFSERIFDWSIVEGVWYPDSGNWARLELPEDEHSPILAIQANDGERAVEAMAKFRAQQERFRPMQ